MASTIGSDIPPPSRPTESTGVIKKPDNIGLIVGVTIAAVVLAALAITLGVLLSRPSSNQTSNNGYTSQTSLNNFSGTTSAVLFSPAASHTSNSVLSENPYTSLTALSFPPPPQVTFVVDGSNNVMSIFIQKFYQVTVTIPSGSYNGSDLARLVQDALNFNNKINNSAFTVIYDTSGRFFTLSCFAFIWSFCGSSPNRIYDLMNLGLTSNETTCSHWINRWKGLPITSSSNCSVGSNTLLAPSSKTPDNLYKSIHTRENRGAITECNRKPKLSQEFFATHQGYH